MVIASTVIVRFAFRRADQDTAVPFVAPKSYVADGKINVPPDLIADKRGKFIMTSDYVDKCPVIGFADRAQIVDILRLKSLVIFAGVTSRAELVIQIFL